MTYPQITEGDQILFSPSNKDVTISNNIIQYQGLPLIPVKNIFEFPALSFALIPSSSDLKFTVTYQNKVIGVLSLAYTARAPAVS